MCGRQCVWGAKPKGAVHKSIGHIEKKKINQGFQDTFTSFCKKWQNNYNSVFLATAYD